MEQKTDSETPIIRSKSIFEKESREDGFRVCVMRFVRDYYKFDLWLRELAPSIDLLNDWKNRKVSWKEYEERYLGEMRGKEEAVKRLMEVIREKKVVTLLCAEKDDRFCHRRLLKEYLNRLLP